MILEDMIRAIAREEAQRVYKELRGPAAVSASPELLSAEAAAALAGVSLTKLKGWLRSGALTRYGDGRAVRIRRDELLALLAPKPPSRVEPTNGELEAEAVAILSRKRE